MTKCVALVTGANGFLGQCICQRLIDEIGEARRDVDRLTIVVTSRTFRGATESVRALHQYSLEHKTRVDIEFDYLLFDQTDMVSVLGASRELKRRFDHIDYIFFNSSHSQMGGIDYWQATKDFLTNPIRAFTVGTFKIQGPARKSADGMGATFEANVFAPWFLVQELRAAKVLKARSRIIWISTSISLPEFFNAEDLGIEDNEHSYEASKYELELLHQATYRDLQQNGIESWLLQPGVFKSTTFVPTMNIFMYVSMLIMFYICRWSGSPYHCIYPELAANAPIWCALYADAERDDLGIKYGSSTTRTGKEVLMKSVVDTTEERNKRVLEYVERLRSEWLKKLEDQIVERVGY